MDQPSPSSSDLSGRMGLAKDFRVQSHRIFRLAHRGIPRIDFLREVSALLLDFSGCDALEIWFKEGGRIFRGEAGNRPQAYFRFLPVPSIARETGDLIPVVEEVDLLGGLVRDLLQGRFPAGLPCSSPHGSFWISDREEGEAFLRARRETPGDGAGGLAAVSLPADTRSLALIPLSLGRENLGLLQFRSRLPHHFSWVLIEFYEGLAETLAAALAHRRSQAALRERVKELTCLYGMAHVMGESGSTLEGSLQRMVELLPPAWLYPESAGARIVLESGEFVTARYRDTPIRISTDLVVGGNRRGKVEVIYIEEKPERDEGPFLREERSLLDTVARELSLFIARREAEEEMFRLQEQLRHADRLATIGQLAAGVAHELNEPLGNILGFAQLLLKDPELSLQGTQDAHKIIKAALHAREVIRKMLLFARQQPLRKDLLDFNSLVEEGLYFLESRCAKGGIHLVKDLDPGLPRIMADQAQMHQVLINLVVNALQAMPEGGTLTIRTRPGKDRISLVVEDTGSGMSDEVKKKIFLPFFTTKELGQGTGLGLPVVHGIVTNHGGAILVESEAGRGSKFEVFLPIREEGGPPPEGKREGYDLDG